MQSLKRPKRGETEEDLWRLQKEFLSEKKIQKLDQKCEEMDENPEKQKERKIADNHDLPQIVTNIVERNVDNSDQFYKWFTKSESNSTQFSNGFPKAVRRSDNLVAKSGKSLFAQHMSKTCAQSCDKPIEDNNVIQEQLLSESVVSGIGLGINNWKSDINQIRDENQRLIEKLEEKEIQELRRDLLTKLSEKTVQFLVNKNKTNVKNKSIDIEMNEPIVESIDEKDLPIKQKEVMEKKWLNMNVVEKGKLLWMSDIKEHKSDSPSQQSVASTQQTLNARFDFEANLIDNSNREIDVHSGLYHHQLEESSAGYTIQELYTLIQSSFSSQKVLGLQVLAKLLTKAYSGLFDDCFNESLIEQLMKNSALVLVTRVCLADNSETVWRVAINALHAMLCNTLVDELFLDRGFTLFNQCLEIDKNVENLKPCYDSTKLHELSDEQLLKLDVIECLVKRTSLLQRIRYLLEFYKRHLDSKSVNDLLDILIRISRHSSDCRQDIMKCPYLLDTIVQNFIPVSVVSTNEIFDKPNPKALKLFRLLTTTDSQTTIEIINSFPQLIEAIKVYLTLNPENCANSEEILKLSIESLRVWMSLLSQKVCVQDFWEMFPIVIKQLQYCSTLDPIEHKNNFDFQYSSTLLFVLKVLVQHNQEFHGFDDIVVMTSMKWLTFIKNAVIVPNFDSNLCVLSAIEFVLMSKSDPKPLQEVISKMFDSKTFLNKLMNALIGNSNLIKLNVNIEGNKRDSSNLPSFGSIYYRSLENTSILNNDSSICLLLAIIRVMKTSSDQKLTNKLNCLKDYIIEVINTIKFDKIFNLFDFYELNFLAEICLLCSSVTLTAVEDIHCYLNLSILMISLIKNNTIKQKLLTEVVFNKRIHYFRITDDMAELSLNKEFNLKSNTECFDSIKTLYENNSNFDCSHWVFDPIIKFVKNKMATTQEVYDCLLFIELIVKNHKNYLKQMISSSSAVFCLISSVFLISEVFFDKTIETIMYSILKIMLTNEINCRIEDRVPYFETAGDFFAQFLEHFESDSYGNKLFVNYLLVFCQTKCSQLFRIQLFSEHLTALRVTRIGFEEVLIPIQNFLFPIETNSQLLESYLKALLCGGLTPKDSPLLYLIAIHHLNHNLFRSEKDISTENKDFVRLIRSVHNSRNELLKQHLFKYSHFDSQQIYGIFLKSE